MRTMVEPSPREWYHEAARVYVEGHQACAWCGGQHQVYQKTRGHRVEYYCPACDFYTFYDQQSGQYFAVPGRDGVPHAPQASMSQTTTV